MTTIQTVAAFVTGLVMTAIPVGVLAYIATNAVMNRRGGRR